MSALKISTRNAEGAPGKRVRRAALAVFALLAAVAPGSAAALSQGAQWTVTTHSAPTNLKHGGAPQQVVVDVQDTGGAPAEGATQPIAVTAALPPGLTTSAAATATDLRSGQPMSCTTLTMAVTCTYSHVVSVDDFVELAIPVEVQAGAAEGTASGSVSVSGGGAPAAAGQAPLTLDSTPAGFAFAPGSTAMTLSGDQAGAHADLTTSLQFASMASGENVERLAGHPKEVIAELPPGFVGDLADTPRCPVDAFALEESNQPLHCPLSTQVGLVKVAARTRPVFNLSTNPGEIARLGFVIENSLAEGSISLRPGDYGVQATFQGINNSIVEISESLLTVWGVPADPIHDAMRGLTCAGHSCSYKSTGEGRATSNGTEQPWLQGYPLESESGTLPKLSGQASTGSPIPYLTSPTQCTEGPLTATLNAWSWEEPARRVSATMDVGPLTGCDLLGFGPEVEASPDTTRADSPSGFTFDLKMNQAGLTSATGLSSADIKDTTVTLPQGIVINPGQAAGLGACQDSQTRIGLDGPPQCPSNSKVGHVEVRTPLIKEKLEGDVYVMQSNPPDLKLLVAPEDKRDGIYVKFVGDVHLNESTGQLVTTFENTPELPFSDLKLSFSGGAQAALATPTGCGTYTTTGVFTPWSGEENALTSSSFAVDSGPGGSACAAPLPFAPSLVAGPTSDQAGGFTNFSLLLQRPDGQQRIDGLSFTAPAGLTGELAHVPLCTNAQAEGNECPAASKIGHTVVESGPGPYPLVVPEPGQPPAPIYLTESYGGAPFGLSIVVPLHVGPFTLPTQRVRAKIEINPVTAQLTVATNPLPQEVAGVPTDLREVDAVIERPQFMVNPTNCTPAAFSGTAYGTPPPGVSEAPTSAPISNRMQVGSCRSLEFTPKFAVSTTRENSKAEGASLTSKVSYPNLPQGSEANIAKFKVELPKQLPSRLTTLQKACTARVFEANPASCPPESFIGHVTVHTPLLPVPLIGPAIFVSHGSEAFPSLTLVLQGDGVTVDIVGSTFISKAGVTSTTFKTVPDAPFETFELVLPQGPYSALAANGNLCKLRKTVTTKEKVDKRVHGKLVRKHGKVVKITKKVSKSVATSLKMPIEIVGQNGAAIHRTTPISVTGCPRTHRKAKVAKRAKRTAKARRKKG